MRHEDATALTVKVQLQPMVGQAGPAERDIEATLADAVKAAVDTKAVPMAAVRVVVQMLGEDGALLAAAANAVGIALLDAGVPLKGCLAACCCGIQSNGQLVLDPTAEEGKEMAGTATVVTLSSAPKDVLAMTTSGRVPLSQAAAVTETAVKGCDVALDFARRVVSERSRLEVGGRALPNVAEAVAKLAKAAAAATAAAKEEGPAEAD